MGGQVVDTVTAEEFMQQVLQSVEQDELRAIAADAERKASLFSALFGAPEAPGEDALLRGLRAMFGLRRHAPAIVGAAGAARLGDAVRDLVHGPGAVGARFDAFCGVLDSHAERAPDIAAEILHFTAPESYWLWAKWMWDPRVETGSLRLVTMEEYDLSGETPGETYVRVGEAIAFVNETGRAVGFTQGSGPFGIDVFLACAYGVYMYTVLRMRMTQEFNHVVPELPELARRLLGVYRLED